jgi:hypothetical protein
MVTKEILMSHPIKYLRNEVKKANIMGFATMKKDRLVAEMMKRKDLFSHIVASGRKGRVSYEGKKRGGKKAELPLSADMKKLAASLKKPVLPAPKKERPRIAMTLFPGGLRREGPDEKSGRPKGSKNKPKK